MACVVLKIKENLKNATFHQINDIILEIQDEQWRAKIKENLKNATFHRINDIILEIQDEQYLTFSLPAKYCGPAK